MPTDDFLTRYIGTERTLRSVSIRNRLLTITKTWTMEGAISTARHFPPWVVDLNAVYAGSSSESVVLNGMWLAQFAGSAEIALLKNERVLTREDGGTGTASGTYGDPQWYSFGSMEPDNLDYVLQQGDVLRPSIQGVIGTVGQHLSVTVVFVHFPAD